MVCAAEWEVKNNRRHKFSQKDMLEGLLCSFESSVVQEKKITNYKLLCFLERNVIKSIKCVKLYSTFYISYTIRTNGLLYLTGHNECPLLTILLT